MQVALGIRDALRSRLGLTVSVGVAPGRICARLVGPLHKPDCVVVLPAARVAEFLFSRRIQDVPSLG